MKGCGPKVTFVGYLHHPIVYPAGKWHTPLKPGETGQVTAPSIFEWAGASASMVKVFEEIYHYLKVLPPVSNAASDNWLWNCEFAGDCLTNFSAYKSQAAASASASAFAAATQALGV